MRSWLNPSSPVKENNALSRETENKDRMLPRIFFFSPRLKQD
jgi:hypothetical protein